LEVFPRSELQRIDEDADHRVLPRGHRPPDEAGVAFVEGAHGGNQTDAPAGRAGGRHPLPRVGDGVNDLDHDGDPSSRRAPPTVCPGAGKRPAATPSTYWATASRMTAPTSAKRRTNLGWKSPN